MPRPRIVIPLGIAAMIVGAAYVARSLVIRGGDFRPDLPEDGLVVAVLALGMGLVAWTRRRSRRDETDKPEPPDARVE